MPRFRLDTVPGEDPTVKRLSTGIPGLDTIFGGGLPVGSLTVVAGAPGTGKTILAEQICFRNATAERKAIYYSTLSEPPEKFISHAEDFDFFDRSALVDKVEFVNLGEILQDEKEGGGFVAMMDEFVRKCLEEHAADVVESAPEFSLADGLVELAFESHEPTDRRWLRVRKLRGSKHLPGRHSLRIDQAGISLFVRPEAVDGPIQADAEPEGRISTGVPGLDQIMHGGLPKGGSTLVLGPSGCGKTAMGLGFVVEGLEEGERCLYVTFQENHNQLRRKAANFGWDLSPYLASGKLRIYVAEGALDLDVMASFVRDVLAENPPHRMVIDSLAEMVVTAREFDRFPAYARSLLGLLQAAGVSVLATSETSSLGPTVESVGAFLYENIVLLRYIEQVSEVGRAVAVLKMRHSDHEKGLWSYTISDHGLEVEAKLESVTGLLGWSALMNMAANPSQGTPLQRLGDSPIS